MAALDAVFEKRNGVVFAEIVHVDAAADEPAAFVERNLSHAQIARTDFEKMEPGRTGRGDGVAEHGRGDALALVFGDDGDIDHFGRERPRVQEYILADWGYWGLFFSAFIAGSILPFSSEAVMIVLVHMGLDPVLCVAAASLGNTLGGMSCYWIGTLGKSEWVTRLGVSEKQLARARRFLSGRGALMAFFAFLPTIGEAIAIVLGLMRSNVWLTGGSMLAGKTLRYIVVLATFEGAASLF